MSTEHEYDSVALVPGSVVRPFARAALLAALTGVGALLSIPNPFSPAPISLQVPFVFLAGLYLGPLWGSTSMLLYIAAGAVGAPIFATGTAGVGVLFGDTGGFIWSYLVAAFLIGVIVHGRQGLGTRNVDPTERTISDAGLLDRFDVRDPADASLPRLGVALGLAMVVIYAMGAGYAMWLLSLSPAKAIGLYVVPFVIGDLVKMVATITIVRSGLVDPT